MAEDMAVSEAGARSKPQRRKRTKGLLKRLQEQVEFYFGDANLPKDKFLQQKIHEHPDGYVCVNVIAEFKKMKSITSDLSLIQQAILNSSLVQECNREFLRPILSRYHAFTQLSDDKLLLRRTTPLPDSTNVDLRTIYVENLPATSVDHDYLQKLFGLFGAVVYISLPRHKLSGTPKGFAFIEYSSEEEARAAVEQLQPSAGQPLTPSKRKPSVALGTPTKPVTTEAAAAAEPKKRKLEEDNTAPVDEGSASELPPQKRARIEEESCKADHKSGHDDKDTEDLSVEEKPSGAVIQSDTHIIACESVRVDAEGDAESQIVREPSKLDLSAVEVVVPIATADQSKPVAAAVEATVEHDKPEATEETASGEAEQGTGGGERGTGEMERKLVLKRKRDESPGDEAEMPPNDADGQKIGAEPLLKAARLDSQSSEFEAEGEGGDGSKISAEPLLKAARLDSQSSEFEAEGEGEGGDGSKMKKKKNRQHRKKDKWALLRELNLRAMSKTEWLQMKKVYRDMQKEHMRQLKSECQSDARGRDREKKGFVSHCLVKVACEGAAITTDKLREVCCKHGEVAYVDFANGDSEGFVRFATEGCVEKLVTAEKLDDITFSAVSDEDERAYFLKTQAARKQNRRGPSKTKRKMRGQDKIISKALKKQYMTETKTPESKKVSHIHFSEDDDIPSDMS